MVTSLPPLEFLTKTMKFPTLKLSTFSIIPTYYSLRVRGTDRKTQSPLVGPD